MGKKNTAKLVRPRAENMDKRTARAILSALNMSERALSILRKEFVRMGAIGELKMEILWVVVMQTRVIEMGLTPHRKAARKALNAKLC